MTARDAIRGRLPLLYRPEPGETGTIPDLLEVVGGRIDSLHQLSAYLLQQHWFRFSDTRVLDPVANLLLQRSDRPALLQGDLLVITDAAVLVDALGNQARPLDAWLAGLLRADTADGIGSLDSGEAPSLALQRALLDDLHRIIRRSDVYETVRFDGIALDPELVSAVTSGIGGAELTRRNRDLLLAAFPSGLVEADHDWPSIRDLARIGSLVDVAPRAAPPVLRDTVESYRTRVERIVALYLDGLGTIGALRAMTEAQLPRLPQDAAEGPDRPFTVEELAPITSLSCMPHPPGPPEGLVGPLMRWEVSNPALTPSPPTLLITGVEPGDCVSPTMDPMIELYRAGSTPVRIAVGFRGPLAPGATLRLRPAFTRYVIGNGDLLGARSEPGSESPADPTVTYQGTVPVAGAPSVCAALSRGPDGALWVATETGTLHRFDGASWGDRGSVGGRVHQLFWNGMALLIAAENGLHRLDTDTSDPPEVVPGLPAGAVNRIFRGQDGGWWYATQSGVFSSDSPGGAITAIRSDGAYFWVGSDEAGALLLGGDVGLLHYDPANHVAHRYSGMEFSETERDWESADTPATIVGLPRVLCARRDSTGTLWIGTEAGLAAYRAEWIRGATYHTRLLAWPDLVDGPVHAIEKDERGHIWFATSRGALRFDGRDMHHRQGDRWVSYLRADMRADGTARGAWRYDRAAPSWQYFDASGRQWRDNDLALRTAGEQPVSALIWFDSVLGELGTLNGGSFTPSSTVDPASLFTRVKPDEQTIRDGGAPFLPRIPAGTSTWRYLRRESDPFTPPAGRPYWSSEGRLFPPPVIEPTPPPGRFARDDLIPPEQEPEELFAYDAEAAVELSWQPSSTLTVLVRLARLAGEQSIDQAILDEVWSGVQKVRPAAVRAVLAVDEAIVRTP